MSAPIERMTEAELRWAITHNWPHNAKGFPITCGEVESLVRSLDRTTRDLILAVRCLRLALQGDANWQPEVARFLQDVRVERRGLIVEAS